MPGGNHKCHQPFLPNFFIWTIHSLRWATQDGVALPVHTCQQDLCGWEAVPGSTWWLCHGNGKCLPGCWLWVLDPEVGHSSQFEGFEALWNALGFRYLCMHWAVFNSSCIRLFLNYVWAFWLQARVFVTYSLEARVSSGGGISQGLVNVPFWGFWIPPSNICWNLYPQ